MRLAVLVALAGCGSDGVGTVVYTGRMGQIASVDVATGAITDLDPGTFGEVSIAPDGAYVVYAATDWIPRLNDLHGHVTALAPAGNCCQVFRWNGNDVLTYAIIDQTKGAQDMAVVPARGGIVRVLDASDVAVSSDGSRLAYLDRTDPDGGELGDLVVEDVDGGNRQVILAEATTSDIQFTPGDGAVTYALFVDGIASIERADLATLARSPLGEGRPLPSLTGGSRYSPDGKELLAVDSAQNLVGIALADGAAHTYATASVGTSFGAAAYVDNGQVVANLEVTTFEGDAGFVTEEIAFADGASTRILTSSDGSNVCDVRQVSVGQGQLGLQCRVAALTDLTGELITSRDAPALLGISGDGNGILTLNDQGLVELVSTSGTPRTLVTTAAADGSIDAQPPFAAYAP